MELKEFVNVHKEQGIVSWKEGFKFFWYMCKYANLNLWFHKKWTLEIHVFYYDGFWYSFRLGFLTINWYDHY